MNEDRGPRLVETVAELKLAKTLHRGGRRQPDAGSTNSTPESAKPS
jgi:hypothetical protein